MANLNLKGLWIPIEILTDKNLSDKEKTILSIILFLSKENNTCFCTNGTISELLNISSKQVSKLINSLKAKGYICVTMKLSTLFCTIFIRTLFNFRIYNLQYKIYSFTKAIISHTVNNHLFTIINFWNSCTITKMA